MSSDLDPRMHYWQAATLLAGGNTMQVIAALGAMAMRRQKTDPI